jgi:hypothetical protein
MEGMQKSNLVSRATLIMSVLLFWVLLVFVSLVSFVEGMEVWNILTNPVEGFKDYPFGTESGYAYRSKEVYFATVIMRAYVHIQAIVLALLLWRWNQKVLAVAVLIMPFLVGFFIGMNYGGSLH